MNVLRAVFLIALGTLAIVSGTFSALAAPVTSKCLAVAGAPRKAMPVAYKPAALANNQVSLTFVGHSTFLIESPEGVRIATDYAGWHGTGPLPDVVTMNHAHETHYTEYPDPGIKHVLKGWNPEGGWAEHNLTVGDVHIRNIPTNIRTWEGVGHTEKFGNSIFIFELSGLCIGHLGHLHHELTAQQLGQIGQLDIVLAPVDGTWTLDHPGMLNVLKALRARIVIPMHYFGSLDAFLTELGKDFTLRESKTKTVILSPATMPLKPEILILAAF